MKRVIIQINTVDDWNPAPVEVGTLSHYLQGLYIPGGCLGFPPSTVSFAKGLISPFDVIPQTLGNDVIWYHALLAARSS